jgi:hypothetical protein
METAPEIDQLASVARRASEQYAPYVEDLIALVADAVKTALPDLPSDQVGAVLLVVADKLAKADADRAHTLSAVALTNTMSILGARLYSGDAD